MAERRAALLVVDVQNDFVPGGALPVPEGDRVVPVLNEYIRRFREAGLPVYFSRDWHPERTRHFKEFGGAWPPHCVQGTPGAEFHPELEVPTDAVVITKGADPEEDAYSAFQGRTPEGESFAERLRRDGVTDLYVGGLATDYCVRASALDALAAGLKVTVLVDAVRGVDVQPGDSERALAELRDRGAETATLETLQLGEPTSPPAPRPGS
ncbi:nicotinamidase [Thermomicrobiaceae bacterium CFH 74404]|uniref:nicotinamidase n=1 Tax=Thermalbibacter longus TaxID=2951981 RepID=A0AA42BC20_9BACT|nr:nicotinamidase [Thermalbibacter longus]MCM8750450.1 nicotinamidase [Thermalbibacter longus]